jgi:hypothetical protein
MLNTQKLHDQLKWLRKSPPKKWNKFGKTITSHAQMNQVSLQLMNTIVLLNIKFGWESKK